MFAWLFSNFKNFFRFQKIKTKMCFGTFLAPLIFGSSHPTPNWLILLDLDSTHQRHQKVIRNSWSKPNLSAPKWSPTLPKSAILKKNQILIIAKPKFFPPFRSESHGNVPNINNRTQFWITDRSSPYCDLLDM